MLNECQGLGVSTPSQRMRRACSLLSFLLFLLSSDDLISDLTWPHYYTTTTLVALWVNDECWRLANGGTPPQDHTALNDDHTQMGARLHRTELGIEVGSAQKINGHLSNKGSV